MFTRVLATLACGAAGYFAASALHAPSTNAESVDSAKSPVSAAEWKLPTAAESAFIGDWERLRAVHGGDNAALYTAIKDTKDAFRQRAFRSALIAEWSVTDPKAALAYLLEKDPDKAEQLAREWMRRDPQGAITGLLAGGEKARAMLRKLLNQIAKVAPSRLVEVLAALKPRGRWADFVVVDAFATFAVKDSATARAAAESVTGAFRAQAIEGVARAWAEKDGVSALAWAQAMPAGEARDQALRAVLIGWAKTDPVVALGKLDLAPLDGEASYYDGRDTGALVLSEAAKKDWDATISWLRNNPGKLGPSSLQGLGEEMAHHLSTDTAGTMRLLATAALPGLEKVFKEAILHEGYLQRDTIWNWLDGQPSSDITRNLRGTLLHVIAVKEPEVALGFLEKIPDTPENATLLSRGAGGFVDGRIQTDHFDVLINKASPKIRPYLITERIFDGYGMSDESGWIARLDEFPVESRANVTSSFARIWARNDPQAAVQWASTLSDTISRDGAFGSIASVWAENEPQEAARWVDTLAAGTSRDNASRSLVFAIASSEPETAWEWALSIQSPKERIASLQVAYTGLRRKDPTVAEQMLDSANLPAGDVNKLRETDRRARENEFLPR